MAALATATVGLLERRHPARHHGSLIEELLPGLRRRGARVRVVHAEHGVHRIDRRPAWDVTLLKSGSPSALHLAAAACAFGIPSLNDAEATRLSQDRLASTAILTRAGLPVPSARLAWVGAALESRPSLNSHHPMIVKAARGSQGAGLWQVAPGGMDELARTLPSAPYLLMDRVAQLGDDLKVFVAGGWVRAIRRPFPPTSLAQKRGRPAVIPRDVEATARRVGELLGLRCYGCDFVESPDGWWLVDVNAFPGYKGAEGAAEAIADEVERTLAGEPP